jgi:hypothetical protein
MQIKIKIRKTLEDIHLKNHSIILPPFLSLQKKILVQNREGEPRDNTLVLASVSF